MKTIWKFQLLITDTQEIKMPADADILSVQIQRGQPCLWAKINPETKERETRVIFVYGTGHPIQEQPLDYIGTFQMADGALVFHVFEPMRPTQAS